MDRNHPPRPPQKERASPPPTEARGHPGTVLVIDMDDTPFTAVMYPGFDVYMADHAGMGISTWGTYEALSDDPRYQARIQQHAAHLFGGKVGIEMWNEEWDR